MKLGRAIRRATAGRAVAPSGPSASFLSTLTSSADSASYTFSAVSLGAAAADRLVVVGLGTRRGAATPVTGVTIGGVAATVVTTGRVDSGVAVNVALAYAVVPTGTTGDVVVTFSVSATRLRVGLWRVVGLTSTVPTDTDTSAATPPAATLTTGAAGIAVGVVAAGVASAAGGSVAWTGAAESFDAITESNVVVSGALATGTAAGSLALAGAVTSDTPTPAPCGAFASWA